MQQGVCSNRNEAAIAGLCREADRIIEELRAELRAPPEDPSRAIEARVEQLNRASLVMLSLAQAAHSLARAGA